MNSTLLLAALVMGGGPSVRFEPPAAKFDPPSVPEAAIAKSKEVPYATLYAHCSQGGSGTLYVGAPASKDAAGVFTVLPSGSLGMTDGVYDCLPGNLVKKRAVAVAPVPFGKGAASPTTPITFAQSATVLSSSSNASPATGTSTFIGVQRVTSGGTSRIAGFYYGPCSTGNCPR